MNRAAPQGQTIEAVVADVRAMARDVLAVSFRERSGGALMGAAPGAHIDLHLPNGLVRQYSLVNALGEKAQDVYTVAVARDARSRGGSSWIHERLRVGQALQISPPRNHFALDPTHRKVLLLAGGIGMTPLYAMARFCQAQQLDWEMVACVRSASRLAFDAELRELAGDRLRVHADDEAGAPLDVAACLAPARWDGVYACGPAPMLDAVQAATASWPAGKVRMERFQAVQPAAQQRQAFELRLARSEQRTTVGCDESVLDALERLGVDHPSACREGLCGTCEAAVVDGEVQHLDHVIDAAERAATRRMMVCVSRCAGPRLVLDI